MSSSSVSPKFSIALTAEILRRSMARWSLRAHRAHDLRQRAEFLQGEHGRRLLLDAFGTWYDKRRERELRPAEEETQLRHEDALMFSTFDKWTAKSHNLLAVQFDQRRVRAAVLPRWKRALQQHHELKRVSTEHDRRLMGEFRPVVLLIAVDAFSVWKAAYRAKMAKKPYRARRRLQGSPAFDVSADPAPERVPMRHRYGSRSPLPEIERERERVLPPRRDRDAPSYHHRPSMPNLQRTQAANRPRRSLPPAAPRADGSRTASPERPGPTSVVSEPAYSRLRSELASGKDRGEREPGVRVVSDEGRGGVIGKRVGSGASSRSGGAASGGEAGIGAGIDGRAAGSPGAGGGMSELVRALRYGRV